MVCISRSDGLCARGDKEQRWHIVPDEVPDGAKLLLSSIEKQQDWAFDAGWTVQFSAGDVPECLPFDSDGFPVHR